MTLHKNLPTQTNLFNVYSCIELSDPTWYKLDLSDAQVNGFIITWILHQIIICSKKVKLVAG